ncbi:MAG: glycosyltransferase family 2 protein [Candidatus Magnetobacterium sp. LHC-1]|nr:glycosyltransferase family 2 protein [Nitrospirota bacterium]
MDNRIKVSFVIPNWNQGQLLKELVESIDASVGELDKEIIVVDNASADGSEGLVVGAHPHVFWISNKVNEGYAKATNKGAWLSTGDFIFLLNNDVVLQPDTVIRLLECLDNHPRAGAVAPVLYYPEGGLQITCRNFPSPIALVLEKMQIAKLGPFRKWKLTHKEHLCCNTVLQPMASALLIRRQCWQEVGALDERFPIFFNDVDWCYRLYKETKHVIMLCPQATAVHHEGASIKRLGYKKRIELLRGLSTFYLKHYLRLMQ